MIVAILIAYVVLTGLAVILYLPKLFGFRYAFRKPPYRRAAEKRRIAVVVPARDESKIIGDLFDSIDRQDYDPAFFTVNVIVKDPSDPTVALAEARGARVTVVPEQTRKGDALDGYFKALSQQERESYDAFVIVDADAVLDSRYLSELNNALEHDYDIYITRKYAKNFLGGKQNRTVFSNCSALTWPIIDDLGNTYRMRKDIPLNLCGQGMMLRRNVIEELGGWPYRTLTEDYELKLDSLVRGFRSMFYPYAILYTEEALGRSENHNRRVRWLTGYAQCDKKYKEQIRAQVRSRGKYTSGEREYFFGIAPLVLFAAATSACMVAGAVVTIAYAALGNPRWYAALALLTMAPFIVLYVLLFLFGVLAMFAEKDAFRSLSAGERLAMLFYNPFYLLEYIPIYMESRRYVRTGTSPVWKNTERSQYDNIDIDKTKK